LGADLRAVVVEEKVEVARRVPEQSEQQGHLPSVMHAVDRLSVAEYLCSLAAPIELIQSAIVPL
jgi:hypothetical protein